MDSCSLGSTPIVPDSMNCPHEIVILSEDFSQLKIHVFGKHFLSF